MNISPYLLPRLPEFHGQDFLKSTARSRPSVETLIARHGFERSPRHPWVSYWPRRRGKAVLLPQASIWTPKVYVCVGAASYWPFILRCMERFAYSDTPWKFYMGDGGYERPDKIIFYTSSTPRLKKIIAQLRPLLPVRGLHVLGHAVSTGDFGLEQPGRKGLYIGADPRFIEPSWRAYRSHCLVWADSNAEYLMTLPGGRASWFQRMNLSMDHEGPASLSPRRKDIPYVRRYWRFMHS